MVATNPSTNRTPMAEWLPPSVAARRAGVSPQTVRRWLDRGALRGTRTRLGRLVDPTSLEALARIEHDDDLLPHRAV
jgi:predicted site-specific integrase-resolvase